MQLSQNFSAVDVTLPPENLRLREGAMIEIGKFIDKVARLDSSSLSLLANKRPFTKVWAMLA